MHQFRKGPVDIEHFDVHVTSSVPTRAIASGDLLAAVSSKMIPASAFTWDTDLATTRAAFVAAFVGVSEGRSRIGSTDARDLRIPVNTNGTYEMDCTSASYTVGQLVGPKKDSGNALMNTLEGVSAVTQAIGRVVEAGSSVTRIKVRLLNTITLR